LGRFIRLACASNDNHLNLRAPWQKREGTTPAQARDDVEADAEDLGTYLGGWQQGTYSDIEREAVRLVRPLQQMQQPAAALEEVVDVVGLGAREWGDVVSRRDPKVVDNHLQKRGDTKALLLSQLGLRRAAATLLEYGFMAVSAVMSVKDVVVLLHKDKDGNFFGADLSPSAAAPGE
jgi:hypothetical protein